MHCAPRATRSGDHQRGSRASQLMLASPFPVGSVSRPTIQLSFVSITELLREKEKPRQVGAFLYINYWRREPESNRPKRLCRPLHNRFAIAPQADWNLSAGSQTCWRTIAPSERSIHQTKRE